MRDEKLSEELTQKVLSENLRSDYRFPKKEKADDD